MRRWFAILLLVLLPLQALWAAAAPYCAHEENPTSMHVGHHTHEHQDAQGDSGSSEGLAGNHADCQVCHGGAGALPPALMAPAPTELEAHPAPGVAMLPAPPFFRLDRPNWSRLA